MRKISLPFFYSLGIAIGKLIETDPTVEPLSYSLYGKAYQVQNFVDTLFSNFPNLTVSKSTGKKLSDLANKKIDQISTQYERPLLEDGPTKTSYELDVSYVSKELKDSAVKLDLLLAEELRTLDVYQVSDVGIYSTPKLVNKAEEVLPPSMGNKVDRETKEEIKAAGRCLAFDLFTASGFHILRATERVIHSFYLITCKPPTPDKLNWGAYIKALRESDDSEAKEVAELLQQIKDNRRNLIMHPEITLTSDDAIVIFQIATSAILAMANKLPVPS